VAETAIEWTDATWNPVTGCDRISPGCAHCYALTLAKRLKAMRNPRYQVDGGKTSGPGFGLTLHPDKLAEPLGWGRSRMVFVNSMSDLFHEAIPFEYVAAVFGVMAATPDHTYQVLTKRPARMLQFFRWRDYNAVRHHRWEQWRLCEERALEHVPELPSAGCEQPWPLPNVWLGVTIENRRFVDRADLLRQTPATVRFISAEPLLGPVVPDRFGLSPVAGPVPTWNDGYDGDGLNLTSIDWLIAGGESGPGARHCDEAWLRDLRDACADWGTAYFLKQLGTRLARERGLKGKGGGNQATLDGELHHAMPDRSFV
jgi:protein gp37